MGWRALSPAPVLNGGAALQAGERGAQGPGATRKVQPRAGERGSGRQISRWLVQLPFPQWKCRERGRGGAGSWANGNASGNASGAVRGAERPRRPPLPNFPPGLLSGTAAARGSPGTKAATRNFGKGGGSGKGRRQGGRFLVCFVSVLRFGGVFFSPASPRQLKQVNLFLFVFLERVEKSESA